MSVTRRRVVALAVSLGALALPGSASAAVIGFDDLTDAPAPGSFGKIVNVQYAGQGVTFNDIRAFNYADAPGYAGFPRSPKNAVEPACPGVENCQAPVRATFTTGQNRVSVWAGFSSATPTPVTARLIAYDDEDVGEGNEVGRVDAALPTSTSGPAPVSTPLALDPPGAPIRRVEVTTASGFTSGLTIDDFEFSTVGPPPPCNANGPPTLTIFDPAANNPVVQNNLFALRANAFDNGAAITDATLELVSPAQKTRTIYPGLIDADGGNFNVTVGELLEPGVNEIRLTATNCAGIGTSASRQVTFNAIPGTARFRQLGPIEVNQAVQDPTNQTRLVAADGTNFKRTFARVYLGLEGAAGIDDVSGTLTAFRPDGSRPDGPLLIESLNAADVRETNTLENVRANTTATTPSDLTRSLNFELPREWLAEGRLHLELTGLKVEGVNRQIPCDGCLNPGPGGGPDLVAFHRVPPVRIWLFRVPYQATATAPVFTPTQNDIDMLASWLRRAYPTAEVRNTNMFFATQDDDPEVRDNNDNVIQEGFTCDDINAELSEVVSSQQAQHAATRYYGVVDDGGGFMRGCAQIGGRFGSGPAGATGFAWDTDGTYADWYGGHEIGHMYDRRHPGQCTESDDDDNYPYPNGLIGDAASDYQGIDAGNTTLGLPMRIYDWRDAWADVMTYCDNQWISNYSYRGILSNLCNHAADRVNCPDRGEIARSPLRRAKGGKRKLALSVSGELDLGSGRVRLGALSAQRGLALSDRPKRSPYEVVLRRPGRDRSFAFAPRELSDLPAGRELAQFNEVVPFDRRTRKIAIERAGSELAAQRVSRNAPSVKLAKLRRKGERVKVRWRSRDRDGGRRTHSVLYSPDGKDYLPLAAGLRGRAYTADLGELPGGKKARIRVVANDGVLAGAATSKPFKVRVKAPEVSILAPEPGGAFDSEDQVRLVAQVEDLQDSAFPAKRIVWRSSVQGELGAGPSLVATLEPGSHELTATATNRGGRSGSASVRVEVDAVPPVFDAG